VRTEQLRHEFGLTLRHTVFPLHPETPDDGLDLAQLFAGRGYDLAAVSARLRSVATELGLPLGERTRTYNSRRAQELGKWAELQGHGKTYRDAIFHAYFVAGRNLARPEVLADIAADIGLDADQARQVVLDRTYAAAVDADWQRARELGVTAVPTFRYRDRLLVGFTPYESLRRLINHAP
jgi:predicted DsbA family dithiol-disulfide isomerase